jgi:hypothetical protein
VGRVLLRIPVLRRFYVRRLLKFIDTSKARGRRLPPDLYELSKQLSKVPKSEQAAALERALKTEREGIAGAGVNRQARRAAERQSRPARPSRR